ncbi:hypothetical protein GJ496_007908 [Pomphorhynchus laevis]|nr:hypothetical protein GJ496_007908 [Pomphorhynchus laevis]
MPFGEDYLLKYGWTKGNGCGKNKQGITEPVRCSYKFDNKGLGSIREYHVNNQWWEDSFDAAAKAVKSMRKKTENTDSNKRM